MNTAIPQSKLWIYLAVVLLPFNGGYVNAITLINFLHNSVGYVTGNLVFAGTFVTSAQYTLFFRVIGLFFCFLLGTFFSGLLIKTDYYHRDYRYGINLILQFFLVLLAMILFIMRIKFGEFFLATAMGMQNAMTTHYGTALVRTTHMTGTTTDLGILLAYKLRKKAVSNWKIKIYILLIGSFFLGATVGGLLYPLLYYFSLIVSLVIYIIMIAMQKL